MSAITNAPRITCRRPKTVAQAKREAEAIRPCPDCEYCGQPKTWDTTRYIKGMTFMNKDACISCYKESNDGYEWDEDKE